MHICTLFIVSQLPPKDLLTHVPHPIQPRMQLLHLDVSYSLSFNDAALVRLSYCIAVVLFCVFSVSQNVHRAISFIVSFLFFISLFSHIFTVSHVHISSSVQSQQNHLADTQTHVATLCPQLRVLKVVNNHALTDQGLLALAKGCPLLFELNLTGLYVHSVCMMVVLLVVHLPVNMNRPDWTLLGVLCLHACSLLCFFYSF